MADGGATRERYLSAVVTIQQMLLERSAGAHFANILPVLGRAAGADRCYYFEHGWAADGTLHAYHRGEWCRPGIKSDATVPEVLDVPAEAVMPDVIAQLAKGQALNTTISQAPPVVAALMEHTGTKSLLILPILVAGELAGIIGFDNCAAEAAWHADEVDLLRAAATAAAVTLERALTEARLTEANEKLHHHFEQTPLAVIEWDRDFRVAAWSRRAVDIFGWSPAEVLGKTWSDWHFVHDDDFAKVTDIARHLIDGSTPHSICKNRNYTKAGREVWCEWYNSIQRDAAGTVVYTLSLVLDITERIQAEAEVAHAHARTAQAEKMAALGQMASGVAHDFNNALTVILGKAELLIAKHELSDKARATVDDIRTAGLDAADTVVRMRQFVHGRATQPQRSVVELSALAQEVVALTRERWFGGSIHLEAVGTYGAHVQADAAELRELLTNLIVNAAEAMPEGGQLTVSTGETSGRAFLRVADTGIGMDATTRRRCFEPFFTNKGVEHSGLGLAVGWTVARRHGGELTAESVPGRGSEFVLWLPAVSAPAPDLTRPLAVLVIDDQPDVVETLGSMLRHLKHDAVLARSGVEGLQLLDGQRFDLVITDFGMPGMDGLQVGHCVKAGRPLLPVVLLTGLADDVGNNEHGPHAVDRVVGKPVSLTQLRRLLADMFPAAG